MQLWKQLCNDVGTVGGAATAGDGSIGWFANLAWDRHLIF
jgi:hypothetical protein